MVYVFSNREQNGLGIFIALNPITGA